MTIRKFCVISGAIASAFLTSAVAEDNSADVLIRVLVAKGILTEDEASAIRYEVSAASEAQEQRIIETAKAQAIAAPAGLVPMPKALDGLKLYGDARFRYQFENAQSVSGDSNDRSRWRYRARFGADYGFKDSGFTMGTRIETASANDSTNATFGGFFDKTGDELYFGLVYLNYEGEDYEIRLGKHKHPFMISSAFWDSDINPEGVSEVLERGAWTFSAGQYLIDDERESREALGGPTVSDDYLFVGQAKWDNGAGLSVAPMVMATTGGISTNSESAGFSGENARRYFDDLFVVAVPFAYSFEPNGVSQKIFGTWGANIKGDDLINDPDSPFFAGAPDNSAQNQFFNLGYQYGSAKRTGDWQFGIEYRFIEAASFTPNLSDSDFAKNHTNQAGFVLSGRYSFTDFLQGGLTVSQSDRIDDGYVSSVADAGEVFIMQVDAAVKF